MPPLYVDEGKSIVTHSLLKTMRRCPKQADYKYRQRLKPRRTSGPLRRGTWTHELLELHHNGEDWKKHHKKLSAAFNEQFDEEKDFYGDLPDEISRMMNAYVWHYKNDPWKVVEREFTIETEF